MARELCIRTTEEERYASIPWASSQNKTHCQFSLYTSAKPAVLHQLCGMHTFLPSCAVEGGMMQARPRMDFGELDGIMQTVLSPTSEPTRTGEIAFRLQT